MDFGSPPPPPAPVPQRLLPAPLQQTAAWERQWTDMTRGECFCESTFSLCICCYVCVTHTHIVGRSRGLQTILNVPPMSNERTRANRFSKLFDAARSSSHSIMVSMTGWHQFKRGGSHHPEEAEWLGFPALNVVFYIAIRDGARAATGPREECEIICLEADSITTEFDTLRISAGAPPPHTRTRTHAHT